MEDEIIAAVEALRQGDVILYPTDTIWGIGCDATDEKAVARVFEIKKRVDSKSLIILVSDLDMLARHVRKIPEMALDLIEINDRPMTIIYPEGVGLAPNVIAEDGSVGIRIPLNDFCKEVIRKFGRPVVSTSANISGEASPTCYEDINAGIIGSVDHIVDPCLEEGSTGLASQIIKLGVDGQVKVIR